MWTGGLACSLIMDHPQQPVDYIHPFPDGPVWTWRQDWRVVGGVRLRVHHLVVSIVLRGGQGGLAGDRGPRRVSLPGVSPSR
jgi:hypothetical protein